MRSLSKMAAAVKFLRPRNNIFGGSAHPFISRNRPVLRELYRCLCSPAIDDTTTGSPPVEEPSAELGEVDPADHTEAHLGQFYTVPKEVNKTVLSNLLTKGFLSQCTMTGNTNIMIRQPALDVIQQLKGLPQEAQPPKFIFHGVDGGGKSLSLAHVTHYCYTAGWFILLVPSVFRWVHGSSELEMSTYQEGRFDQPAHASAWLQMCRSINAKFFSQVKTSQSYKWGKRDSTKEGELLGKVIDQGLQRTSYASDAVGVILKEIKDNPSLRVLYAVNEFNGFFQKTSFMDAKQKFIKPSRLSLIHHFTKLLDPVNGLKRGAMAFALSRTGMERSHIQSCTISDLLGEKGLEAVQDFTDIHVPSYSPEELEWCLKFYKEKGMLAKDLNPDLIKEIAFLSNYEPRRVSGLSGPY